MSATQSINLVPGCPSIDYVSLADVIVPNSTVVLFEWSECMQELLIEKASKISWLFIVLRNPSFVNGKCTPHFQGRLRFTNPEASVALIGSRTSGVYPHEQVFMPIVNAKNVITFYVRPTSDTKNMFPFLSGKMRLDYTSNSKSQVVVERSETYDCASNAELILSIVNYLVLRQAETIGSQNLISVPAYF